MKNIIEVKNLSKSFRVYQKEPGLAGSLKHLFVRKYYDVKAVEKVNFSIQEGELVGFIGPNGAGKTTTLKMLSGLLYPSFGSAEVLGFTPWERKKEFQRQFSIVMGQKNQLWWDLSAYDSFILNRDIYQIPQKQFLDTLDRLVSMLDLKEVVNVQVRKLSLGQRMKAELVAALLHSPKVLFLDEPTIGLDVVMQKTLRDFIKEYNKETKATIILTSHYMEDVKELCERVIMIDKGKLMFDGPFEDIIRKYADHKILTAVFDKEPDRKFLETIGTIVEFEPLKCSLRVAREEVSTRAASLLTSCSVADLTIEESKIEDIIREIFSGKDYA